MRTRTSVVIIAGFVLTAAMCHAGSSRVNGLAIIIWRGIPTQGVVNPITVLAVDGSGRLDVNAIAIDKEKAVAVLSACNYAQGAATYFGYDSDFSKYDIHIEYDDKYTAQGGGSGAAAVATAIVAALSGRSVRQDVAITGDISQLGDVKSVGGIKEKMNAAYAYGIRTVIVPAANADDIPKMSIDTLVRFQVITATDMRQVLFHALVGSQGDWARTRSRAFKLYQEREWGKCVSHLRQIVAQHPEDLSLRLVLRDARKRWHSIQQGAQRIETLILDATTLEQANDLGKALEAYEEAYQLVREREDIAKLMAISDVEARRESCIRRALDAAAESVQKGSSADALGLYITILKSVPDMTAAKQGYYDARNAFIVDVEQEVTQKIEGKQFAEAQKALDAALRTLPDSAELKGLSKELQKARSVATAQELLHDAREAFNNEDLQQCGKAALQAMQMAPDEPGIKEEGERLLGAISKRAAQRADQLLAAKQYSQAAEYYGLAAEGASGEEKEYILSQVEACRTIPLILQVAAKAAQSWTAHEHIRLLELIEEKGHDQIALDLLEQKGRSYVCSLTRMNILFTCDRFDESKAQYMDFLRGGSVEVRKPALLTVRKEVQALPKKDWTENDMSRVFYFAVAECRACGGSAEAHVVAAILGAMCGKTQLAQWHVEAAEEHDAKLPSHIIAAAKVVLALNNGDIESAVDLGKRILKDECGPSAMCFGACAVQAKDGAAAGHKYVARAAGRYAFFRPLLNSITELDVVFTTLFPLAMHEWFSDCVEEESADTTDDLAKVVCDMLSRNSWRTE